MFDAIGRVFEPLLNLSGRILSFFYDVWPNYAGAILLLTICVMVVLTPVLIKSTRSMLAMRRLAPQVKQLQAQYRHDRQKMNEEMMALYRSNNASPLGGCLPMLMQAPIFIALFQLLRGLARRTSTLGWSSGHAAASCVTEAGSDCAPALVSAPKQTLNPDYLSTDSRLYQDLVVSTEMQAWGFDLAETPWTVLQTSFVGGLRYLGLVALVAVLGYYQQRQISGRMSAEDQTPQARMMMRILPVMLPIFSFGMPTGLVVYYNAQSVIRIGQQAVITRRLYKPFAEQQAVQKALEEEAAEAGEEPPPPPPAEPPKGLGQRLGMASPPDPRRHGRQRPVSGDSPKPKAVPPAARAAAPPPPAREPSRREPSKSGSGRTSPGRAERRKDDGTNTRSKKKDAPPPKPVPSRVTPKGAQQRRAKRYKR